MEVKLTKDELDTLYMCRNKAREVKRMEKKVAAFLPLPLAFTVLPR